MPTLDRDQLKYRWRRLYDTEPPSKIGRTLLQYAIAYALQVEFWGDLKPSVAKVIEGSLDGKPVQTATAPEGTKFLREWNGTIHEVEVLQSGVLYRGTQYRSLSEVAKLITGIHRSGPLFFGLKTKASAMKIDPDKLASARNSAQKELIRALQL